MAKHMASKKYEFEIAVDAIGFFDTYTIVAKDLATAKKKAKAQAMRDFRSSMSVTKESKIELK